MHQVAAFVTRRDDLVEELHGEQVPDPYRWLEDTYSEQTTAWWTAQNVRTEAFLSGLPQRREITEELGQLWDYPRADPPFQRGGRWFQWRNSGLQDQPVLYVMSSPDGEGHVLLDPNSMSPDGTVSVSAIAATDDGALLAYATSQAGSDWRTWHVRQVASGTDLDDVVEWSKYSEASWRKDGSGFYYTLFERPPAGTELTAETGRRSVLFHAVGTPQAEDELVYDAPEQPDWEPWPAVSDDGRFLVVSITRGTGPEMRTEIFDLAAPMSPPAVLVPDFSCQAGVIANQGGTFFLLTDDQAERRRVVAVDLGRPDKDGWREVIAQQDAVLTGALNCGGKLLCHYLEDASSRLSVHELDGALSHHVAVPPMSSVGAEVTGGLGVEGHPDSPLVHFGAQSFTDPGSVWSHNVFTGETSLVYRSEASSPAAELLTELVFVTASDGARVPLFLTRRADLARDGQARVLLYGYGGFDIPVTPSFGRGDALFVRRGGMLATACIRGGGEYGRSWHNAGRLAQKQRVFDDFCDCARWLTSSGWSRPERTGINGGSNGGLLVGGCLVQHPELFGAAVPEVGVLDMLRFHKFTIGWAWKSDYGDPDDPEDFKVLLAYSPLHNIKEGAPYPPTLVMTGDHDDRVVPGHSFKFAAALQAAQVDNEAPILTRVETSTGHGMGKPTSRAIAERADMLTFLEWALSR